MPSLVVVSYSAFYGVGTYSKPRSSRLTPLRPPYATRLFDRPRVAAGHLLTFWPSR